jgi:hypothetical protein
MTPPYLTDQEIAEITAPLIQGAARCRFLNRIGVKVQRRPDGQPLVGRAEFEAFMQARDSAIAPTHRTEAGPDWPALQDRVRYARGQKAKMRESTRA